MTIRSKSLSVTVCVIWTCTP